MLIIQTPMEEEEATRYYWCHVCCRTVDPVMEAEIKCPFCASGFVEEMAYEEEEEEQHSPDNNDQRPSTSLWAPFLMYDPPLPTSNQNLEAGNDVDSQLQEILWRRGRGSVSVMQLLQGGRAGLTLEPESNERGRVILINPVQSSVFGDSVVSAASLSDYFIGPGFEALLQSLAENDPNSYGTPPAQKEAVEALASVNIEEDNLQCSVCLDDFESGTEAKEMPCKHKFHGDCLLPWLELHSSCPVCRYQLPSDHETKTDYSARRGDDGVSESSCSTSSQGSENNDGSHHPEQQEEESDDGDGIDLSIPWLFSSFFLSSQGRSNPSSGTN